MQDGEDEENGAEEDARGKKVAAAAVAAPASSDDDAPITSLLQKNSAKGKGPRGKQAASTAADSDGGDDVAVTSPAKEKAEAEDAAAVKRWQRKQNEKVCEALTRSHLHALPQLNISFELMFKSMWLFDNCAACAGTFMPSRLNDHDMYLRVQMCTDSCVFNHRLSKSAPKSAARSSFYRN